MKKVLAWVIAFCVAFYILGSISIPFISISFYPIFIGLIFSIGVLSSISLIIILIIERIKDREAEKDDLNKY